MGSRTLAGVLALLCAGCAAAPDPRPDWSPPTRPAFTIRYVSDTSLPPQIGKEDLDRARSLLERARKELRPQQWELLDQALAKAEQAWARYAALTGRSGTPASVPRAPPTAVALVGARAAVAVEASVTASLLMLLGSMWPAPTAFSTIPPWHQAQRDYEAALQEVVKAAGDVASQLETSGGSPPPLGQAKGRRPECLPIPVKPHAGGDKIHNMCADEAPPNRFREHDVIVNGVRYDAIQVGVEVLWEIKTERFDTYSDFLKDMTLEREVLQIRVEREVALACGYEFVVGVSSALHAEELRKRIPRLKTVITGC